jgi:DNA polymerase-1
MRNRMGNLKKERRPYDIILLDTLNLAFRYWYGYKLTYQGKNVGLMYGMMRQYFTLQLSNPHATLYFLEDAFSYRRIVYPEYKANRKEKDNALLNQLKETKELLGLTKAVVASGSGWEADDLVGYFLRREKYKKALVVSNDADWYKYSNTKVDVLCRNVLKTKEKLEKELGFPPANIVLYKALKGDSADNVGGIIRFSEEVARKICRECNNLKQVEEWFEKNKEYVKERTKFRASKELVKRNYYLARTNIDERKAQVYVVKGVEEWKDLQEFFEVDVKMPSIVRYIKEMRK